MKVLVTGVAGQLGYDVVRRLEKEQYSIEGVDRDEMNLESPKDIQEFLKDKVYDVIVHCAAYTAVDKAEDDRERVYAINVEATKILAIEAERMGAKLVYISTDYVFEGTGEIPYVEEDPVLPAGYYGKTKLEGEEAVQEYSTKYFIVRISWVFGINGNNFVKTMLQLSETRDELSVVADQIGSPTYTVDVAQFIFELLQTEKYGIYHGTNEGFCSWYEFATEIFSEAGTDIQLTPVTSEEFKTRAVRPKNSRLSKQKMIREGFTPMPTWKDALHRYMKELKCEK